MDGRTCLRPAYMVSQRQEKVNKVKMVNCEKTKSLVEIVRNEYDKFMQKMLRKSKLEIFCDAFEIHVKTELANYIAENVKEIPEKVKSKLLEINSGLLDVLFDLFLKDEYASVSSYSEIEEFITRCVER